MKKKSKPLTAGKRKSARKLVRDRNEWKRAAETWKKSYFELVMFIQGQIDGGHLLVADRRQRGRKK